VIEVEVDKRTEILEMHTCRSRYRAHLCSINRKYSFTLSLKLSRQWKENYIIIGVLYTLLNETS